MKTTYKQWIEWIVLAIVAIRPSMDVFTDLTLIPPPLRLNPASFIGIFLIGLGVVWFLMLSPQERKTVFRQPITMALSLWLMLLLVWVVIPFFRQDVDFIPSAREWIRLLSYLPLFLIVFSIASQGRLKHVVNALLLSLVIPVLVGYYQVLFHQGAMIKDVHRITGTFVHPNPFSFYLVLGVGILYWKLRWSLQRMGWGVLLVVVMGVLMATFSFTGAAMFGVLIVGCILGENKKIRIAAIALMIIFAAGFLSTNTGWKRIIDETKIESLNEVERTGKETTSLIWRLLNWRFLIRTWERSPVFGYGLATSPQINPMKNPEGVGSDPHNDYVRYLAETGAVGAFLWLALLVAIGIGLWRAVCRAQTPEIRNFAWVALALYGAWLVGSLNDNLITATAYQYCLWAVFAAAAGSSQVKSEKRLSSDEMAS